MPSAPLYENQPAHSFIRTSEVAFDFQKKIYPSWYSVINGTRLSCHYHLHQELEFIVVYEGRVDFQVGGRQYSLGENDILIINPFEPHSGTIPLDCDRTVYYAINVNMKSLGTIPNRTIKGIADGLSNGSMVYPNGRCNKDGNGKLLECLRSVVENSDCGGEVLQFAEFFRAMAMLGDPLRLDAEKENKRSDAFIRSTVLYIQSTPLHQVSLEAIADMLSYNKAYFTTLFKKNFGMSFTDYVNNYKITVAKGYIKNGNYNLNDVAEKAGFYDILLSVRHFSTNSLGVIPVIIRNFLKKYA